MSFRVGLAAGATLLASTLLASTPAHADATCAQLMARGGRIADTYVMDFGGSEKVYVYIVRMPDGAAEKCTSRRRLRGGG